VDDGVMQRRGGERWSLPRDAVGRRRGLVKSGGRAAALQKSEGVCWWSSYKTSHPAEERRMGHPSWYF
jgi:hypothetical protein